MDRNQVELFCNVVAGLLTPLATYGDTEPARRDPVDDALVDQLRVAGGAINEALGQVARLTPPAMRPPAAPIRSAPPAAESATEAA